MKNTLAVLAITMFVLLSCGNNTKTYPIRVVSERIAGNGVLEYTEVDLDIMPANQVAWSESPTKGRTWYGSNFSLPSGQHEVKLVESRNGENSTILDTSLKVVVDGSVGGPTPLCMLPDGSLRFTIEADDEVGHRPVGEFFDCYHPVLRVRSSW